MSGHTPGPWEVVDGVYPGFRQIKGPSFGVGYVSKLDLTVEDMIKREADAQLIAAAPDLLSAVRFLITTSAPMTSQQMECWPGLKAAIARATGEKP